MKLERLLLGSSNSAKLSEWRKLLGDYIEIVSAQEFGIESPKEKGNSFKEIAIDKAKYYARNSNRHVLSEDGGFEIDALGGVPGIKSRRILPGEKDGTDEELIEFVMNQLRDVPKEKRAARLVVYVVICDPKGNIIFEEKASIEGFVPEKPSEQFTKGYPYRAVLFIPGAGKTFAEFTPEEHAKYAHRTPVAERMKEFLLEYETDD
jgi:XTP/dITP diphosphohydrolase